VYCIGMGTAHELQAAGELAADGAAGATGLAQQLHEAIAERSFRANAPARAIHDAIATVAYAGVRGSLRAGARLGAAAVAHARPQDAQALSRSPRGRLATGALNGWIGDRLEAGGSALAVRMAVRRRGEDVAPERDALRAAFPGATGSIVVFVHGLCESDEAWRLRRDEPTYAERVRADLGITPLVLRYNTGRHVSDNGRELAALLDDVVAAWPVPVERIALVGHSMGGLVARSACKLAADDGRAWPALVRSVVCLGSPHLGAPLERGAALAAHALWKVPEARPVATLLRTRSAGIKDLRYGALAEEDWRDRDPDAWGPDECADVPLPDGVRHHCVIATLRASDEGPFADLLGDLLVPPWSASGRGRTGGRSIPFAVEDSAHLPGVSHIGLLQHDAVYERLRDWLTPAAELPERI
jgi:pimeloyl-ACP methyl ester carboxylesterase